MTRILIVDDNSNNRYLLHTLLEGHGYDVIETSNGAEALDMARAHPFQLVISDLLMPVMDGYALLREWKADDDLNHIPFLVYTATYTDPRDERLALDLGADAFLVKPAEPEAVLALAEDLLERRGPPQIPSEAPAELAKEHSAAVVRKLEAKMAELERTNRQLTEEKERYQHLFKAVAGTLIVFDLESLECLDVNEAATITYGYSRDEFLALQVVDLWDDVPPDFSDLPNACSDPRFPGQWRHRHRTGRPLEVEGRACRVDIGDRPACVLHIIDVTERHELEAQLRQSQKMEALGRLAGGIAHDFNNLLTIIAGNTELLEELPWGPGEERDAMQAIIDATQRAASLTRQLLTFSRQDVLEPKALDVKAVTEETLNMLRRLIGEDVELLTDIAPDLHPVMSDAGQLGQILLNLAVNARDAMPHGGTLSIRLRNHDLTPEEAAQYPQGRAGPHVWLSVTDDGCGMSPEVKERLFEPFFTTKDPDRGTGLGLSTVFGIVQRCHGTIAVDSAPGKGAVFDVLLPAAADVPAPATPPGPVPEPAGSETILLVDDDAALRELARRGLEKNGYAVVTAAHSVEALELLEAGQNHPDLILTDVIMPGVPGPELASSIRQRAPALKILFMTGYGADVVANDDAWHDAAFIQKPFTIKELVAKVRQTLDN